MVSDWPCWRRLEVQVVFLAASRARAKTGKSIAARIAIMAITTRSSISVNPSLILWLIKIILRYSAGTAKIGRVGWYCAAARASSFLGLINGVKYSDFERRLLKK